ncbi:hypothetical protein [Mycoplasma sp. 2634B]|uniref:hypothetical protein n=1 Tax=Mycoplasma sp. 2634B TaxID=3401692 RepID=UPI003AABF8BF
MVKIPRWAKIILIIDSLLILLSSLLFIPLSVLVFKSIPAMIVFSIILILATAVGAGLTIYGAFQERHSIERTRQATWNIEKMLRENTINNQAQKENTDSRIRELEKELQSLKNEKQINSYFDWENKR